MLHTLDTKEHLISIRDLSFRYGHQWVLKNISLDIHRGEFVGIIGPNGGGKSTLLKLMLGILTPTTGRIECSKNIGYVPQKIGGDIRHFPATAEEIVCAKKSVDPSTLRALMKLTGIENYRHELVGDLSGGQMQRVMITRALVSEPEVLILDEPVGAVDKSGQESVTELLRKLHQKKHVTIILVSHDIDTVAEEVEHVYCLNQEMVCHGSPKTTFNEKNLAAIYHHHHSHTHA